MAGAVTRGVRGAACAGDQAFWRVYAALYDAIWAASPATAAIDAWLTKRLPSPVGPAAVCLDVGCGTGLSARAGRGAGWRVVGVERSGDMLARACRAGRIDEALSADAADPTASTWAIPPADAAVLVNVLQFCADPASALDAVLRVVRPVGPILVVVPSDRAAIGALATYELRHGRSWAGTVAAALARWAVGVAGACAGVACWDARAADQEIRRAAARWGRACTVARINELSVGYELHGRDLEG